MSHKWRRRAILAAILIASSALGTSARADFVLLSALVNGGSIQSGDKLFTNFTYKATGDMPPATAVTVQTITDAAGNFGIEFQGGFSDQVGGGSSDALIGYRVAVTDPNRRITDAHIAGNPSVAGGTGSIVVTETFIPGASNTMSISSINPGATNNTDSTVFATPVSFLDVQKDILAFAGTGVPNLSFVDQTFSQSMPEPASVALLGLGLGAVVASRRFTRRRPA